MSALLRCSTFPPLSRRFFIAHAGRAAERSISRTILRPSPRPHSIRFGVVSGLSLGVCLLAHSTVYADAPAPESSRSSEGSRVPLLTLLRSYAVFSMCSVPVLVDWSPAILGFLTSIPGVKTIAEAFVRVTFFDHFVGGETAEQCIPLLEHLRSENKGALFAYSVEVDEHEAAGKTQQVQAQQPPMHKRAVEEMIHSIDVAADFEDRYVGGSNAGRRTWVAVKLTALLPNAQTLLNFSRHLVNSRSRASIPVAFPGTPSSSDLSILRVQSETSNLLSSKDIAALIDLHNDLIKICTHAQQRGVKIIIDAEYSWYQPGIDAFTHALMERYNKLPGWFASWSGSTEAVQPLVYNTYQSYLRRAPEHLSESLSLAKAGGYALGVKLVRGAYHPHEMAAHPSHPSTASADEPSQSLSISPDPYPPVWTNKRETDECYNTCAEMLINHVQADIASNTRNKGRRNTPPSIGVLFGSHNWESCGLILDALVSRGLAVKEVEGDKEMIRLGSSVTDRVILAQLYGMSDALTDHLVRKTVSSSPFVIKYIPYGPLTEVMPYLSRRAIENKSVLGDGRAADERRRAGAEIRQRLFEGRI